MKKIGPKGPHPKHPPWVWQEDSLLDVRTFDVYFLRTQVLGSKLISFSAVPAESANHSQTKGTKQKYLDPSFH